MKLIPFKYFILPFGLHTVFTISIYILLKFTHEIEQTILDG